MTKVTQFNFNIKPTVVGGESIPTINARELHTELGVSRDLPTWIKGRIEKYDFVENQDFILVFNNSGENPLGGRPTKDYYISLDMAKELAMVENNAKGRAIRQYFIACEKELRNVKPDYQMIGGFKIPTTLHGALALAGEIEKERARLEVVVKEQEAKIEEDAPKVEMYDKMAESEVEVSLAAMAQLLRNFDIKIGRTRLVKLFRLWGWYKKEKPEPTQKYVDNKYFTLKQVYVPGVQKTINVGKLTWKGEQAVVNKIKKTSDDVLESVGAFRLSPDE